MISGVAAAVALIATSLSLLISSPASAQTPPGAIRTGDNYRLGNWSDPARGKVGPGLAVDPRNPNHIVETQLELTSGECEYNTSGDGGVNWISGKLNGPAGYPQGPGSCSVLGHGANSVDAGVKFGAGQNVYAAFAEVPIGGSREAALVSHSTDGGLTFPPAVVAIPPQALGDNGWPKIDVVAGGGTAGADKIVIATNPTRPAAADHANAGTVLVSVSMDSGATWSAPVSADPPPSAASPYGAQEHTQPVFGPNGEIYVAWRTGRVRVSPPDPATGPLTNPPPEPGFLRVAKSVDNGATWTFVNATNVQAEPGFDASSFARLAVDRASGALYLVWNQDAALYGGGFQAQDHFMIKTSQVWFMRSLNGNATWQDRQMLSEPVVAGYQTQTRHPNVSVAPNGRVDVVWHDRRHMIRPRAAGNSQGPACLHTHFPCVESKFGDTYWAFSSNQGGTFSESRRITDRHHDNDVGYDYRFSTYWDFGPVAAALGNNDIMFAWMDSREGNFDTDTQDIYLAKTTLNGGPVPVKPLGAHNAVDFAVSMSQRANPGGSEGKQCCTFASTSATRVVIANENDVPGILAGSVLARANVGPLLVTPAGGLPQSVKDEVARMRPIGAYLIGDTSLLSPQIEADLAAAGVPTANVVTDANVTSGSTTVSSSGGLFDLADINHPVTGPGIPAGTTFRYVTTLSSATLSQAATASGNPVTLTIPRIIRLGGATPAERAANVALQLDRRTPTERTAGSPAFDAVTIANPSSVSASTASMLAVQRRLPYLFVDQNSIPAATANALAALNINKSLVITGPGDVSGGVVASLAGAGRNPVSLGGASVMATSEAVIQEAVANWGVPTNQVFIQDAANALHGALLGQPGGRLGGLQLAVPGGDPTTAIARLTALGLEPGLDRVLTSSVTAAHVATPIAVFRPSTGTWFFQGGPTVNFGTNGDIHVAADYNGDGTLDVAVFRPSNGTWYIQGGATVAFGANGDIPVPGDYNGDGTDDIAVFRPSNGTWYIQGGPTVAFGTAGDIPVPGDYDGNGTTDIAVYRPSSGAWFIQGQPAVIWGTGGDIPVPGDYDGNGTTDIAVFRPSNGTWYIRGGATVAWGMNGDIPVPGDYNADGTTDIAVFRPSNGTWFVRNGVTVAFGSGTDHPVPLPSAIRQPFFP